MNGGLRLRTALAVSVLIFGLASPVQAVIVGSDDAGNYATWANASNGGAGFSPWALSGAATHGFFLGDSTNLSGGSGANINSSGGSSFGMYGEAPGGFADAARSFNSDLTVGGSFSLDLAVNYRNGNKGVDLRDSSNNVLFNFNIGNDDHVVGNAATGNGSIGNAYSNNTAFRLVFTQSSVGGGTWSITRSGGFTDFDSGTYTGLARGFKLYVSGTGAFSENNLMANNLVITAIPEASALAFGAVICGVSGAYAWRSRRPVRQ